MLFSGCTIEIPVSRIGNRGLRNSIVYVARTLLDDVGRFVDLPTALGACTSVELVALYQERCVWDK
jgi:hypothetical protein